ncbi:hypothetical protein ACIPJG_32180 [Streptomyces halstedii]|uniref:hypothetical protein n=1 Tax=Streptomyces halstedii TaxID=1944 RepID=UPI0037FD2F8F
MFKQGDKAVCTLNDGVVEIKSDLFTSAGTGARSYLVEWTEGIDKGKRSVVYATDLEPAPRFKVGQKVRFTYSPVGETFDLVAGPFPDFQKAPFWVFRDQEGEHDTSGEGQMLPVA